MTGVFKKIKIFCEKCNIFIDSFIVRAPLKVTKSRTIRWASHVAQVERIINVYRILLGKAAEEEESG